MAVSRKNQGVSPFLKWAGGKSQLLSDLEKRFPKELLSYNPDEKGRNEKNRITRFVEPFIGGGAVYFLVNSKYHPEECHIFDINKELVLCYRVVKDSVDELIGALCNLKSEYIPLDDEARKEYYYKVRSSFNEERAGFDYSSSKGEAVLRAAKLIFLNRTCYNGLYRVNGKGGFNVPAGRYKNPPILIEESLILASKTLQNTEIHYGDFESAASLADGNTFFYFDPPYRPINKTSSFNSYAKDGFSDSDQRRLAEFFRECDRKSAKVMMSNSDPKNTIPDDNFFDDLYSGFNIERVPARRNINSKGNARGEISEIVVTNYETAK